VVRDDTNANIRLLQGGHIPRHEITLLAGVGELPVAAGVQVKVRPYPAAAVSEKTPLFRRDGFLPSIQFDSAKAHFEARVTHAVLAANRLEVSLPALAVGLVY
jgi:hypothetical protein